jgi:hypothetical protein
MADLLPCPFCGGTDVTWHGPTCTKSTPYDASHRAFPIVRCGCGVQVWGKDWDQSGATAVAKWNQRPAPKTALDHFVDDVEAAEKRKTSVLPEHLILAVNQWFSQNTGLGGCSDKDVAELASLFYGVSFEGGRESVEDALAVVDSFGPGVQGLNDTFARQVLLAGEVKRLRAAMKGDQP